VLVHRSQMQEVAAWSESAVSGCFSFSLPSVGGLLLGPFDVGARPRGVVSLNGGTWQFARRSRFVVHHPHRSPVLPQRRFAVAIRLQSRCLTGYSGHVGQGSAGRGSIVA